MSTLLGLGLGLVALALLQQSQELLRVCHFLGLH